MEYRNNKNETIYDILGIDPAVGQTAANESASTRNASAIKPGDDPNVPSGSIFDNYSNYPKEELGYWRYFRILTIVGIATVVIFFTFSLWGDSLFSHSHSSKSYAEEYSYYDDEEVEEATTEEVEESSAVALSGVMYFKGTINDKYNIHMMLDFDSNYGKYYYDRSGSSNCMAILILSTPDSYNDNLVLEEFNADDEICGVWMGTFDGETYSGTGEFLGKSMPFDLEVCSYSETEF